MRVGRFIGRLGVVSLPAVQAGLDLDERVVRRHVARLEKAGWLMRGSWLWGEGSIAWLTTAGIQGVGLDGLRAVKTPPGSSTIVHGVLVGWSAARMEHRGRPWRSARELAIDPDRWAVPARHEHGYTTQLPDLAAWTDPNQAPIAVISEDRGGRRDERQRLILEGWRDALAAGRYSGVLYECSNASVARWIERLAGKVGLNSGFRAIVQKTAAEIAALPAAGTQADSKTKPAAREPRADEGHSGLEQERRVRAEAAARPTPEPPLATADSAVTDAEREQVYREFFGVDPRRSRRHRRR